MLRRRLSSGNIRPLRIFYFHVAYYHTFFRWIHLLQGSVPRVISSYEVIYGPLGRLHADHVDL